MLAVHIVYIFKNFYIENDYFISIIQLITSFISSLDDDLLTPNITYIKISGVSPGCIAGFKDCLLMDVPFSSYGLPTNGEITDLVCALFDDSIEITQLSDNVTIHFINDRNEDINIKKIENDLFVKFINLLVISKVNIVCCQKRIPMALQELLCAANIYFIQVISSFSLFLYFLLYLSLLCLFTVISLPSLSLSLSLPLISLFAYLDRNLESINSLSVRFTSSHWGKGSWQCKQVSDPSSTSCSHLSSTISLCCFL